MYVVLWVWKRVNREALPKLLRMYDMGTRSDYIYLFITLDLFSS